ncbi:6-phosphogluconolactonase [Thiomicrospira microaerophila]|uniref:6-phosphogluconolactonase n=1 Tax=Thiomicrospira microaerophila TaxID=406020 RepID=UPI00200BFBDB|nr:6-phosphogluconolactonase [Thiomicrospira microaerophila]UQB43331.1 6-phosphogluconolactonase [Thiomicrospira microaerophila]
MSSKLPQGWQVFDDAEILAQQAVSLIIKQAKQAIEQRGEFHLVTAGGTTPNRCYEILAEQSDQAWHQWFIYMGDERVLPLNDPERNSTSLQQAWLSKVSIPQDQIFLMPTEMGLEQSRLAYQQVVDQVEKFDCVLLGMGEDGHTASLFPGHNNQDASESVISVTDSPKPPAERISLSYKILNNTRNLLKLITGEGKYSAIQAWLSGSALPISLPQAEQATDVFIDQAAWKGIISR